MAQQESKAFRVGRLPENDIHLNLKNISKLHLRILFDRGDWWIADGSEHRASVNGTWVSLSNVKNRFDKRLSDPMEIREQDQLKISEYLLTFNFLNFNR